jgi:uncharacterized protein with HEPN domain
MRDFAREAAALVATRQRSDVESDRLLQLALERLAEIVGEAANRVSRETQARFADIPWREVIGMRHRVSHGYDAVSHDTLWDTVVTDFPTLIRSVEAALAALEAADG